MLISQGASKLTEADVMTIRTCHRYKIPPVYVKSDVFIRQYPQTSRRSASLTRYKCTILLSRQRYRTIVVLCDVLVNLSLLFLTFQVFSFNQTFNPFLNVLRVRFKLGF